MRIEMRKIMRIVDIGEIMTAYCMKCPERDEAYDPEEFSCERLCDGGCELFDLFEKAKEVDEAEALRKEMPMEPVELTHVYPREQYECPVCGCGVGWPRSGEAHFEEVVKHRRVEMHYCPMCGQKLDWEGIK